MITQLNELSLADSNVPTRALIEAMADVEPGDEVMLKLKRNGNEETVTVETEEFEPRAYTFAYSGDAPMVMDFDMDDMRSFAPRMHDVRPWARMELIELTPELGAYFGTEEGILIVRAPEEDGLDLRDGDVILEIGDREPRSTGHAMRIMRSFESGEEMTLEIMRDKRRRTVKFQVPDDNRMSRRH